MQSDTGLEIITMAVYQFSSRTRSDAVGSSVAQGTHSLANAALPAFLVRCLSIEGVLTFEDWIALGRRRHQLFGVTRRMVKQLDALARGRP